jgi:hypothetical protein
MFKVRVSNSALAGQCLHRPNSFLLIKSFGEVTTMRIIGIAAGWLACAGTVLAADSVPSVADELVGRWESTSFVTTNCLLTTNYHYLMMATNLEMKDLRSAGSLWASASLVATNNSRQTNLILCVYDVVDVGTDPRNKKRVLSLDSELHFTDHAGKERPIREASGALLSGGHIEFHPMGGYSFSCSLSNGVWTLEKFGTLIDGKTYYKVHVKAALKRVSSEPGERLCIWRAEDGAANRGQPVGSETNRKSAAAGPGG